MEQNTFHERKGLTKRTRKEPNMSGISKLLILVRERERKTKASGPENDVMRTSSIVLHPHESGRKIFICDSVAQCRADSLEIIYTQTAKMDSAGSVYVYICIYVYIFVHMYICVTNIIKKTI